MNIKKKILNIFIIVLILGIISPVFAISGQQNNGGSVITELDEFGNYMFKPKLDTKIKSVDTLAIINENGDMKVKQRWIFNDLNSKNTEHFIVFSKKGLRDVSLQDATVYQNGKQLEQTNWDINKPFNEKSGKFGWNATDTDLELCFGIGQKIQDNTFEVVYTIKDALFNSNDGHTFLNWKFLNDNLSDPVGKARIEIQFPDTVKKIYGFGYDGYVALSSRHKNTVVLETNSEKPFQSQNTMIALIEIDGKNDNLRIEDRSRKEIYKTSFRGSDYNIDEIDISNPLLTEGDIINAVSSNNQFINSDIHNKKDFSVSEIIFEMLFKIIFMIIPYIFGVIIIILIFGPFERRRFQMDRSAQKDYIWRDKPEWEPNEVIPILILSELTNFTNIVNYYMVKWVKEGIVLVLHEEEPGVLWFNKVRDTIQFNGNHPPKNQLERVVYDFIYAHAYQEEITTTQLARIRWDRITNYFDNVYSKSDEYMGILEKFGTVGRWGKIRKEYKPNEVGQEVYKQYRGLRNFLYEFTMMDEREIREVELWDYHLEIAALLGIAEKVQEQLKIYPEVYQNTSSSRLNPVYVKYSFGNITSTINSSMSSGSGGRSSSGGGGGSSGGGSGGGSR